MFCTAPSVMTGRMRSSSPSLSTVARSAPNAVKMRLGLAVTTMSVLAFIRSPMVRASTRVAAGRTVLSRGAACSACAGRSKAVPARTTAHRAAAPSRGSRSRCCKLLDMCLPLDEQAASTRRLPRLARLAPFQKICEQWVVTARPSGRAVDNERRGGLRLAPQRPDQGLQAPDHCLALAAAPARINRGVVVWRPKPLPHRRNCRMTAGGASHAEWYHKQDFGFGLFMALHGQLTRLST